MPDRDQEQHYYEITELYDLAEALIDTVEHEETQDAALQLALVEPLIEEIGEAADILTEEYVALLERPGPRKRNSRIEMALRRVYIAMDAYHSRVEQAATHSLSGLRNIADPIVKKLVRQMEVIVAALIDLVDVSLGRIMSNNYAEELRRRHEKIAQMLHAIAQGAV